MNSHIRGVSRRHFLKLSGGLAALGAMAQTGLLRAATTPVSDYKALVCVFLAGGNDAANTVVPRDSARYPAYQTIRGPSGLALTSSKLMPDFAGANPDDTYALHYGLAEVDQLRAAGKVAIVLNLGNLNKPLQGSPAPANLFSHSDQTIYAQAGTIEPIGSGWGGRLLDKLATGGGSSLDSVSVADNAMFNQGEIVSCNYVPGGGILTLNGVGWWPATQASPSLAGLHQNRIQDGGSPLRKVANRLFGDGIQLAADLQAAGGATAFHHDDLFPQTYIGSQFKDVARMIKLRASQGAGRQVFFCQFGSFDTHGGQDWQHWNLLSQLSAALNAFYWEMHDSGLGNKVTSFTQSEFGRTLQPNTGGTDHGWGGHHFVIGDAVAGGVYGTMPQYGLGVPGDSNGRGAWIPTIATEQYAATLGIWFGADAGDLAYAFPTLGNFSAGNVGFMG
ncbi:DUF1501 domain-containing protein [Methylomagnum sp.]